MKKPTYEEIAEEYKSTLQYVLANLDVRKTRLNCCADDESLVKYFKHILDPNNLKEAVYGVRIIKKRIKELKGSE